jgi:hypothetical protein
MANKKYRIDGKIYIANSPEEAYAMADAANAPPEPEKPLGEQVVRGSADYLNSFLSRSNSTGRKAVNLALPKSMEPSWATDDAIKAHREKTKPTTFAGKFGEFGSDTAVGTLMGAGPEIGMAKAGATLFPRVAASKGLLAGFSRGAGRVAANATSGGLQGALLASPEERGAGAAVGATIAGILGTTAEAGRGLARLLGKNRVDPLAAKVLAQLRSVDPDAEIPNSHLLKPGFTRSIYEGVVANAPLSGGKMRRQHADAVGTGYRTLAAEVMPVGTPLDTVYPKGGSMHDAMDNLNFESGSGGAYDRALGRFNQEMFDTSGFQLPQGVTEGLDKLQIPSTISNDMTGQQLITLRDDLQRVRDVVVAKNAAGDEKLGRNLAKPYDDAREEIQEIMKRKFTTTNAQGNPELDPQMADYLDDLKNYKEYDTLKSAVKQTSTGEPGFGAVAMAAQRKSPEAGARGQAGPLQTQGNDLAEVLGDFPSKQGIFQMGASQGITEGATKAVIPGAGDSGGLAKAAALLANPVLGWQPVQNKVAYGLSSARAAENFFKKHPQFGRFVQSGAISLTTGD